MILVLKNLILIISSKYTLSYLDFIILVFIANIYTKNFYCLFKKF